MSVVCTSFCRAGIEPGSEAIASFHAKSIGSRKFHDVLQSMIRFRCLPLCLVSLFFGDTSLLVRAPALLFSDSSLPGFRAARSIGRQARLDSDLALRIRNGAIGAGTMGLHKRKQKSADQGNRNEPSQSDGKSVSRKKPSCEVREGALSRGAV